MMARCRRRIQKNAEGTVGLCAQRKSLPIISQISSQGPQDQELLAAVNLLWI